MSRERGTMEVEVLGPWVSGPPDGETGACASYVVTGRATVLLDCGPGTVSLLQQRGLTRRLDAVVVSHMHRDHVLDLVSLAALLKQGILRPEMAAFPRPRLFVPREGGLETLSALDAVWSRPRRAPSADADGGAQGDATRLLGMFSDLFDVVEYGEDDVIKLEGLTITFRRTTHLLPCFSPRITDGSATVVYSADTGYDPGMAEHAKGADLFLCEATFLEEHPRWTCSQGHMTGTLAGRIAAEAGVGRLVLTHLGPDPKENEAILESARGEFGGTVDLACSRRFFYA